MAGVTAPTRADETRAQLLRCAERLFLADGYDAVSVRSICAEAGANPAAVHYHFGSKDQLTVALLEDRLAPIWVVALDRIDPATDSVATLVDAVITPLVATADDPVGHLHLRLLARFALTHPVAPWSKPWFRLDHWASVLIGMVDGLSPDDARRRWSLAFELILLRFGGPSTPSPRTVDALRAFVAAGLTSPAPDLSTSAQPTHGETR